MQEDPTYYRRHLPHYQPADATFFVTFRLADSLPQDSIRRLKEDRVLFKNKIDDMNNWRHRSDEWQQFNYENFTRYDELLDKCIYGPQWLREREIAALVREGILFLDQSVYDLMSFCIMPNHVHLIFELNSVNRFSERRSRTLVSTTGWSRRSLDLHESTGGDGGYVVTRVLTSLKKYTAIRANRHLHRSGPFWQHESYDHVIRDDAELERMINYILDNPVKAGFVKSWEEWPWTYCKSGLL